MTEEERRAEYASAPEDRVLDDNQFNKIHFLSTEEIEKLSFNVRRAYLSTLKWHAGKRQNIETEGVFIGGLPFDEYYRRMKESQKTQSNDNLL